MKSEIKLHHGSNHIIEKPLFGEGKSYNDYGLGFYCTESIELAREWACTSQSDGFANTYSLSIKDLLFFSLSSNNIHILNWLSVLLQNRTFRLDSPLAQEAKEYLAYEFSISLERYDVVCGYRADDSYFAFANAFLNGTISLQQLSMAMKLGNLGEQIVLKSKKAFEHISFVEADTVPNEIYYQKRESRDNKARNDFKKLTTSIRASDDVYILDILRGEWKNDDKRLF